MARTTNSTSDLFGRTRRFFGRDADVAATPKAPAEPVAKAPKSFHSVSVQVGDRSCAEAKALEGKRFLSKEAPILPLKKCDCAKCECRYQHHEDRRKGPRRARDFGVSIAAWDNDGPEQRVAAKRGRRKAET